MVDTRFYLIFRVFDSNIRSCGVLINRDAKQSKPGFAAMLIRKAATMTKLSAIVDCNFYIQDRPISLYFAIYYIDSMV